MSTNCRRCVVLIVAIVMSGQTAHSQVEPPATIANEGIRLTINPSVGRVVDFGRTDGPNLMRITDSTVLTDAKPEQSGYQGYGGDQLWPAQQAQWGAIRGSGGGWPPLNELDGPNWNVVDQSDSHITIQSPQTPLLGLLATRRFEVHPEAAQVTITNTFERIVVPERVSQIPVQIWSVTGIVEPEYMLADISPERPNPSTHVTLSGNPDALVTELGPDFAIRFDNRGHGPGQPVSSQATKVGMYGDWLAAVYETDVFLQRSDYDSTGNFPDDAATEIYSSQSSRAEYAELEVLSSAVNLAVGETLTNTVQWYLVDRPIGISDVELAQRLAAIPEPSGIWLISSGAIAVVSRRRRQSFR